MRAFLGFVLWTGCIALSCTSPDATPPAEREEERPQEAAAPPEIEQEAARPEIEVDWENHSPEVRQRIDSMVTAQDCIGLQTEFDVADMNDAAQRDRTGDGNGDLMRYIHEKMDALGCYE